MNYEQKYNEALEKARKVYNNILPENNSIKKILEKAFPELKDSEDERIRKEIIKFLHLPHQQLVGKRNHEEWISWLEKQGNIDFEFFENGENEKREFVGYGFLKCKGDFLSFKEGETYWLEYVGKDNYNVRSDNLLGQTFHITPQQLYTVFRPTTWLEKQGEQEEPQVYETEDGKIITYSETDGYKIVEPKFYKGEWITNGDYTWKIVDVKPLDYILQSQDGNIVDDTISHVDEQFHLWTIQDAKDGDVLTNNFNEIFIFKNINKDIVISHCSIIDRTSDAIVNSFDEIKVGSLSAVNFYPATKEQRDTLMKAMTDAGYTFDFEKKEVRKIKQKPVENAVDAAFEMVCWLKENGKI